MTNLTVQDAIITSLKTLYQQAGWVNKEGNPSGVRRASIHSMLSLQGYAKKSDSIEKPLRELVATGKLTFSDNARGSYYYLVV